MRYKTRELRLFLKSKCQSFTWEQKYEPWIPSLMQVGHWSLASLQQPSVSHSRVSTAAMLLLLSVRERESCCWLPLQSSEIRGRDSDTTLCIIAKWSIYLSILPYCSHNCWPDITVKLVRLFLLPQLKKFPEKQNITGITKQGRTNTGLEFRKRVERSNRHPAL